MIEVHYTKGKEYACVGMDTIAYGIDKLEFADNILVHTNKSIIEIYGDKELCSRIIDYLNKKEIPK